MGRQTGDSQVRGERHGRAVLTEKQVRWIRLRHKRWCRRNGARALARELGAPPGAVRHAADGRTWKHVKAGEV